MWNSDEYGKRAGATSARMGPVAGFHRAKTNPHPHQHGGEPPAAGGAGGMHMTRPSASARARPGGATASSRPRSTPSRANLDYLCFETMAEATISAAQVRKRREPDFPGYDTYLDDRMQRGAAGVPASRHEDRHQPGLDQPGGRCAAHRPLAARISVHAGSRSRRSPGGLITDRVLELTDTILENGRPTATLAGQRSSRPRSIWAPSRSSMRCGKARSIVVSGRVADPVASSWRR